MVISNKKLNDILSVARELFWKHGFRRVSIEEICKKAGVSKMTYYKYFPNKIELAKTIFNKLVEDGEKRFHEIIKDNSSPAEKVKNMMLMKLESTRDISPEFMQDFYTNREPEIKAFIDKRTKEAWVNITKDLEDAKRSGIFRKDFRPELLMKIQYKIVDLFEDESFIALFDSRQDMIMEMANLLVYGIIPHD